MSAVKIISLKGLLAENIKVGEVLKFSEVDIHIERKLLTQQTASGKKVSFEITIENLFADIDKLQQTFLLSDGPGTGKTTEFKMMAETIKKMFAMRWVVFVNLQEHIGAYEADGNISHAFESHDEIAKHFCEKVLKIKDFEARAFTHLFSENRIVFFMDGFDEISPRFKEFNMNLVMAIHEKTRNLLLVSTRAHLENELKENLSLEITFKLKPFTSKQSMEYFEKVLHRNGISEKKFDGKVAEMKEFFQTIDNKHATGNDRLMSPIIVNKVSEIFANQEDFQLALSSFYTIYDTFTRLILKKYNKKG